AAPAVCPWRVRYNGSGEAGASGDFVMRNWLFSALAGLALVLAPSFANAQYPGITSYNAWVAPTPYYVPGPMGYSAYYSSPYGYRSAYSTGIYPTPWGLNAFSFYSQQARPIYSGPYHS